ncbi:carbohydrate ABC transporter permease [bacterium]|nr:carbohydrate ABC transporter permease [bacterium]
MKKFYLYTILILVAISTILPFIMMFIISLSGNEDILLNTSAINLNLCSYRNVFASIPVVKYFLNSLIVSVLTTIFQVIVSTLAGYGFARLNFKFSKYLLGIIVLTMMVPSQVNVVPLFYLMSKLGWINTYQALIVPGIFGGFGVLLMYEYFKNFSKELEDASKLDGCTAFKTFFYISLPYAIPAVATLAVFTFITTWNSFLWPLIATNTDSMRTLTVGLAVFKSSFREITMWGELSACACVCSIPVIVVFLTGKKYIINTQEGALKE